MIANSDRVVAAIDIGTNSMHLVVARLAPHGGFEMLTTEKEMVRLGQASGEMKKLTPDAIDRGIDALDRMAKVATSFGDTELVAVATSAVREARNRQDFLDRARDEVGIDVEVISGFEEARLIHLGVLQALPVYEEQLLVVDIGGGSTELLVGRGSDVIEARSMKLGAIRLTQRFFPGAIDGGGDIDARDVEECRRYARAALAPVARELGRHRPDIAIGASGTIATVAEMAAARRGDELRQLNGARFDRRELDDVVDSLVSTDSTGRRSLRGLDDKRADIIVAGAVLLQEIVRAFALEEMTVSGYALREGVLFDRFGRAAGQQLSDLRRTNVLRLARQLDPDPEHAEHTAELATQIFDQTTERHRLDSSARELLVAASIVHNVGLFISHSSHHKHSYYVVRNSEQLTGFSDREIELIALIARYHRKSSPSAKHAEFAGLSKRDRTVVRTLAGMLRLAIGLDRRHSGLVRTIRIVDDGDALRIEPFGDDDLELEVYAANERAPLLADVFGVRIEVATASAPRAAGGTMA